MATSTVSGGDPVLVSQCLDFCQALASMGQAISFSLTLGSSFSFTLDTRRKTTPERDVEKKKKPSPSTLRRNKRRKEEFLKNKIVVASDLESSSQVRDIFQCEHCEHSFTTANGLRIHIGKSHKALKLLISPEKVRDQTHENSLSVSPVRDTRREEEEKVEQEEAQILPEDETHQEHLYFDDENEKNNHAHSKQTDAISGLVVVRNWDKEPKTRKVHLLDEVLLEPPTKVFCRDRGIGVYEKTCHLGSFFFKFDDGTIDEC